MLGLVLASILQITSPPIAYAELPAYGSTAWQQEVIPASNQFCNTSYGASGTTGNSSDLQRQKIDACKNGYLNGKGDGTICSPYEDEAVEAACRAGYTSREARFNSGGADAGNGTTPGGSSTSGAGTTPSSETDDKDAVTCAVEKIGWIVCPIIETSAMMADNVFNFLADNFLEIEPELLTAQPSGKGTINAWEQARNLANIMFVIAFIVVIYSQITGSGLNNYGIKRMLPRLIIAAIAVNVSYYICQAMVDISNLLGYNIMKALQDISNQIGPSVLGGSTQGINTETSSWLGAIAIGALAAAAVVWIILPMLGGIVLFIFITCLTIVIILLLRKAFIVLLVVASPIAFVAYLLPNTEKLFDKWLKMFWQLLMVFPVVALLMGGGQLASTIILVSGAQDIPPPTPVTTAPVIPGEEDEEECDPNIDPTVDADPQAQADAEANKNGNVRTDNYALKNCEGFVPITIQGKPQQASWTLGLVAAGVAVAPLIAVWAVLKGALSAAGAIGGKISGAVQKGSAGGVGGIGKFAKNRIDKSAYGMGRDIRKNGKEAYKRRRVLQSLGSTDKPSTVDRYRQYAAGGVPGLLNDSKLNVGSIKAQNQAINRAASAREQIDSEEVKNELTAIEYAAEGKLKGAENAFTAAMGEDGAQPDTAKAKAAVSAFMTTGEAGIDKLASKLQAVQEQATRTGNHELADTLKEYIMQAHGDIKGKNAAVHAWATGGYSSQGNTQTVNDHAANAATYSKLSDAQFATQTQSSLSTTGARTALGAEAENAQGLKETRGHRLLSNPDNATNFSDAKRNIIASNGGNVTPHA